MAPIPQVAALLPLLSYLDAKYQITHDLRLISSLAIAKGSGFVAEKRDRLNPFYSLESAAQSAKHANRPFLIYQGKQWTYKEMYTQVLRYGTWLKERYGVKKDEIVAMDFMNSPAFIWVWWGLWSIGAMPAFVNYNLGGEGLVHSIKTATARLVIVEAEVAEKVFTGEEGQKTLERIKHEEMEREVVIHDEGLERVIGTWEPKRAEDSLRSGKSLIDSSILIYTSGTTGLPKAAVVSYLKSYYAGYFAGMWMGIKQSDIFYTCMPIYHSSACLLGVMNCLQNRATLSLGRKFSNSTYWPEVRASRATIIQYVGEVCRYLLAAPPSDLDKQHNVRIAFGNGLRPDIWEKFKERFGIETIAEFYASTEGMSGSWNLQSGKYGIGAIGRNGKFLQAVLGRTVAIVKLDYATELPYRDPKTGFCIAVPYGEPGELLWKVDEKNIKNSFQGYFGNNKATESKILRDVFKKGDAWFRSGDVQTWTADGLWYFIDRIGDTFRWKSENVATSQVGEALTLFPGVKEANVYGVLTPHHDGNAGCAAVILDEKKFPRDSPTAQEAFMRDLGAFITDKSKSGLPLFAVPIFLRVRDGEMVTTGNFKQVKHGLRVEGVDPEKCKDEIWWLRGKEYRRFTKKDWEELKGGKVRL